MTKKTLAPDANFIGSVTSLRTLMFVFGWLVGRFDSRSVIISLKGGTFPFHAPIGALFLCVSTLNKEISESFYF